MMPVFSTLAQKLRQKKRAGSPRRLLIRLSNNFRELSRVPPRVHIEVLYVPLLIIPKHTHGSFESAVASIHPLIDRSIHRSSTRHKKATYWENYFIYYAHRFLCRTGHGYVRVYKAVNKSDSPIVKQPYRSMKRHKKHCKPISSHRSANTPSIDETAQEKKTGKLFSYRFRCRARRVQNTKLYRKSDANIEQKNDVTPQKQ